MSTAFDTPRPARDRTDLMVEISCLRAEMKAEFQTLRSELRETGLRLETRIEVLKADLIKWVAGMIGFQTVVLLGAALALAR